MKQVFIQAKLPRFSVSAALQTSTPFLNSKVLIKPHIATMHLIRISLLTVIASLAAAAPTNGANSVSLASCNSYTIINTRGTGESQGESAGFRTINSAVRSQVPGGVVYNTVYPAGWSQNSAAGTQDIIRKVDSILATDSSACVILEGYSQGAAATVNALPRLTGSAFDAVKGVFLIGNPIHKSGLECNVDNNGGTTTRNVNGLQARGNPGIPQAWVAKTRDVCIFVSLHSERLPRAHDIH